MNSKKDSSSYLNHFLIIGSGSIINMILGFIITPIITRIVDPAENGMMSMFTLYASISMMVLSLGLDQGFVRFYYNKDSLDYKKQLLKFCIMLPLSIAVVISIIFVLIFKSFPNLFEFNSTVLWFLVFYVLASLVNRISLLVLRVEYRSKIYSLCNIANRIAYLIIALLLIKFTMINSFLVLIIATLSSSILSTLIAIYNTRNIWLFKDTEVNINTKDILKFSMPLIIANGLAILFQGIDKLSLNYFCSYSDIGIYSAALSIVSVFEIVQTTFNTIWSPLQIEQYTKNDNHKQFIQKANKYIVVIMFFIGFCLIMFKGVFALFLGEKYRDAAFVLPFLSFYPIMYTISETTKGGIDFTKKTYLYFVIISISCIFNICGNVYLIPRIGYKGAAISTGISYIVYFYLNTKIAGKLYYIDFQVWKIYILIVLLIIFSIYNTFYTNLIIDISMYIVSLLTVFLLYRNTVKELFQIGKNYVGNITKHE